MKKKLNSAEAASDQQEAADYVVGQVSGSLFQKKKKKKKKKKKEEEEESAAAGSSLSSLFSAAAAAPTASLLFQPAPKLQVQRNTEEKQQDETPEVKGQTGQKTKTTKVKTAGEEKLENRESALQEADDDERGQETKTKAAKRKRKASEAGGVEKEAEHWVMKRQRLKASKEEEALKRKRTVFVGNLPVSCTKKTLRSLFRDKGSIESIRFRSVVREDPTMSRKVAAIQRKIHPKKQSVNAYVVFKDEEGVAKALERNGLEIEKDFHIRVDRVTDGSGQQQHDHKRSVFVGNLSFEISDLAFRRHFEDCGPVEAVRLVRDRDSGLGKGFGYVLFEGADSVQLALKLDGSKLEGRSVRVKRSVKKEKEKKNKANNNSSSKNTGTTARAGRKGPAKGPAKRGGFKSPKRFTGNQPRSPKSSGCFKGEMVDPTKKTKKKLKKKVKPKKKSLHI